MQILTWNIMVDDNNPERYKKIARMIINEHDLAIVCLQEVSVIAWHYMKDIFNNSGWLSIYPSPLSANSSFRTYGEMILYLPNLIQIHECGFFLLPSSKQGRTVQWCVVSQTNAHDTQKQEPVHIATGHLESYVQNQNIRIKQWEKIISEFRHKHTYWFGDCNMTTGETCPETGTLYSYGDTYFSNRFAESISPGSPASHPYDRVWTNDQYTPQLMARFGFDKETMLSMSDHDGLILKIPFD